MRSSGSSQSDEANLETKTGSSKIDTSTHRVFWSNLNWGYRRWGGLPGGDSDPRNKGLQPREGRQKVGLR